MSKLLLPRSVFIPNKFIDNPSISAVTLGCIAYCYANPEKNFEAKDFEERFKISSEIAQKVFKQLHALKVLFID